MVRFRSIALFLLVCAAACSRGRAATLVSTLNQQLAGTAPRDFPLAIDFLTGNDPTDIFELDLGLGNGDTVPHTYRASLLLDDAGSPGSVAAVFDTTPSCAPTVYGTTVFTDAGIRLEPNTIYWLVLQQVEPTISRSSEFFVTWSQAVDVGSLFSLIGTTQMKGNPGSGWQDSAPGSSGPAGYDNFMFSLKGTAVPEPSGCMFLILSLAVFTRRHRYAR